MRDTDLKEIPFTENHLWIYCQCRGEMEEKRNDGRNKSFVLSNHCPTHLLLVNLVVPHKQFLSSPPPSPRVWDMRLCPRYPTHPFSPLGLTPIWEVKGVVVGDNISRPFKGQESKPEYWMVYPLSHTSLLFSSTTFRRLIDMGKQAECSESALIGIV